MRYKNIEDAIKQQPELEKYVNIIEGRSIEEQKIDFWAVERLLDNHDIEDVLRFLPKYLTL